MAPKRELYDVLGVMQDATEGQISRAYRQLALRYHPDRNPDGEVKFKEIANAYGVLSDAEKRRMYDATGVIPGNVPEESEATAAQRSAEMKERVERFYATYAGSQEEREDVVRCYSKYKGNFRRMVREELLFDNGNRAEIARLHTLVSQLVETGTVPATEAWRATSSAAAVKKIERMMLKERKAAKVMLDAMGLSAANGKDGGMGALQALIRRDQEAEWANMMSGLEEKYLKPKKTGKKKAAPTAHEEDPPRKRQRTRK